MTYFGVGERSRPEAGLQSSAGNTNPIRVRASVGHPPSELGLPIVGIPGTAQVPTSPAGDKASRNGTAPKRPVHKRNKPTRNDVHVGCMINGELGWRRSLILHRTTSSADGPVTLLATAAKADATQDGGRQGHKHARFRYGRKGHKTPLPTQSSVELAFFKITGKVEGAAHEHRVADSL